MMKSSDIDDEFFEENAKKILEYVKDPKDVNLKDRYERLEPIVSHELHDYFHRVDDDWKDDEREAEILELGLPPTPRFNQTKRENQVVDLEGLLGNPGREYRPKRVLIFIRGAPGSGKSFFAKNIIKKEDEMGGRRYKLISCNRYYAKRFNDQDIKSYKDYLYDELKEISEEGFYNFVVAEVEGGEMEYYTKLCDIASHAVGDFEFYVLTIHQMAETCIKFCRHGRKNREIEKIVGEIDRNPIPHSHRVINPKYMVIKNPNVTPEDKRYKKSFQSSYMNYGNKRSYISDSDDDDDEACMACTG